jgi:hypothetical protein
MWSVENLVPLRQLERRDWTFVSYEDACRDPDALLRRLRYVLTRDGAIRAAADPARPSTTAVSPEELGWLPLAHRAGAWRSRMSRADRAEVERVVESFGLTCRLRDPRTAS